MARFPIAAAIAATDDSRRLDSPHRGVCADDDSVLQAETSPRTSHEPHRQTSKLPSPPTSGGLARQPSAVEKPAYTTPTGILQRSLDDSEDKMSSADDWSNDNGESVAAMGEAKFQESIQTERSLKTLVATTNRRQASSARSPLCRHCKSWRILLFQ
ncbi:unnamed protein product [Phytophthora lilii]|uniref:Unnamed protein product n=1 Tax=Phytophthora lilii TaxID=2077276 RepID=A0A9W6X5I0_9STRA|nr:unnamed protein product [Phytophthora lilii]